MTKGFTSIAVSLLILAFAATSAFAQAKVSQEEKDLCIEAVNDLTDGKPPADAVKLCGQGKVEEAMEKAMTAQGG